MQAGQKIIRIIDSAPSHPYGRKITAPDGAADDRFGYSVSQSGNILVIGSREANPSGLSNAGEAYVYSIGIDGSSFYRGKLIAPDAAVGDYFGNSLLSLAIF